MKLRVFSIGLFVLLLAGCANRGVGPQGGPKDSIPPVALKADPELGALHFDRKRIEITFNEYIELNNIGSNLLLSPPQATPPDVKARGKRLVVQFQDTLLPNTTYTIDFGDAVCDFTERNPVHGFYFYFSTGDEIDTLECCGRVYDAMNLNPLLGIYAGIHSDPSDTAFIKKTFLRVAKTDSAGMFRISNVHEGQYRLYAVDDVSKDYRLTAGEALAFIDKHIQPGDTTDLFLFREEQQKLYMQRTNREEQHRILLSFSAAPDSAPQIRPLSDSLHYITHYSTHRDTVTIWLTDSMSIRQDSIYLEARYRRTDSLLRLEWFTDTIRAVWRAPKLSAKAREAKEREARNRRLSLQTNAKRGFDIYDTLRLNCSTPLATIRKEAIRLMEKVDTGFVSAAYTIIPYDTMPMQLAFVAKWKEGVQYELRLDSAALYDLYGTTHIQATYPLQIKQLTDYSTLRVRVKPFNPQIYIQVLNAKDQVIREAAATEEGTLFEYLKPDTYYLRMYIDADGNGKWTTGSWEQHRQPEQVYYYPEKIQTKSNWDFDQEWDYTAVPQTSAKPAELIKASSSKK